MPQEGIYYRFFFPFFRRWAMAEAPVAIPTDVLEAVRPAAIPPSSYLI